MFASRIGGVSAKERTVANRRVRVYLAFACSSILGFCLAGMSVRALVGLLLQLDTNYVEVLLRRKGVCVTGAAHPESESLIKVIVEVDSGTEQH